MGMYVYKKKNHFCGINYSIRIYIIREIAFLGKVVREIIHPLESFFLQIVVQSKCKKAV